MRACAIAAYAIFSPNYYCHECCFVSCFFKRTIHISINQKSFTESSKESHECLANAVLSSINRYSNGAAERLKTSCLSAKRVSLFSGLLSLSLFVTNYVHYFAVHFSRPKFSVVVVVVVLLFACSLESTCNIS